MFCPNCNAEMPEGTAFCANCGQKLNQQDATNAAPVGYVPPQYPNYAAYPAYAPAMNNKTKKEVRASDASESTRSNAKLAVLVCLIAVGVIIAGIVATLTMPIFDIPALSLALEVSGADVDELMDELENGVDELEDEFEYYESDFSKEEKKDIENFIDTADELVDNFSIAKLFTFVETAEELVDEYGDELDMEDVKEATDAMVVLKQAMLGIMVFVIGFFFLPILFAVLGGTLKNTALTIVGMVFTAIAQLIFCGIIWVAASLVVGVVQAVLCSKVNTEYRNYRMGKLPA